MTGIICLVLLLMAMAFAVAIRSIPRHRIPPREIDDL